MRKFHGNILVFSIPMLHTFLHRFFILVASYYDASSFELSN